MLTATFDFGTGRKTGEVIRVNDKTVVVLVKGRKNNKVTEVKRHKEKHHVDLKGEV